jgi:hypothetical protein
MRKSNITIALAASVLLSVCMSSRGFAQAPARRAVIALVDELPETEAKAVVIRYAATDVGDVILLRKADATPVLLGAAVRLLTHLRRADSAPSNDEVISIAGAAHYRGDRAKAERVWGNVLQDLSRQPRSRIGNVGDGQWITATELVTPKG